MWSAVFFVPNPLQSISKQLSLMTWFSLQEKAYLYFLNSFFWSRVLVQRRRMIDGQLYVNIIAVMIKMHYSKCISFLSIVCNSIKRFLGSFFFSASRTFLLFWFSKLNENGMASNYQTTWDPIDFPAFYHVVLIKAESLYSLRF